MTSHPDGWPTRPLKATAS